VLKAFREAPTVAQLFIINLVILCVVPEFVIQILAVERGLGITIHSLYQVITSVFLHGGFMHLFGNFFFLLPAALYMEKKLLKELVLAFYLLTGIGSSLLWIASGLFAGPGGAIGSSGAVYGVVAGALMLLGLEKNIWLKLLGVAGLTYALSTQLLLSIMSLIVPMGVAFFGHLGGILAALILLPIFFLPKK
jgi:membrane associated rhomboid family serine protease